MPRPLLPSGHAREDTRGDEVQRAKDDGLSPIGGSALYLVEIKATDILLFLTNLLTLGERNHNNNHNENGIFGYLIFIYSNISNLDEIAGLIALVNETFNESNI